MRKLLILCFGVLKTGKLTRPSTPGDNCQGVSRT